MKAKQAAQEILESVGITINGSKPWDPRVHDDRFYQRVMSQGSLGLGESYMDAWWDCDQLDEFFTKILRDDIRNKVKKHWPVLVQAVFSSTINRQSKGRAFKVGEDHYDTGNDLYEGMLDQRMVYTCGYWKEVDNLDDAQEAKLDLVCRKINLQPKQKVLDIGCGWGSFAKFAAEKYGAEVVGVTVSKEQVALAKERCAGLPIEIRLQDYRGINETFDRIVSLGMVEHVGYKNYRDYMKVAHRCLSDDGLFLLHTIGGRKSVRGTDPWIDKYIFTNSMLPSVKQLAAASEGLFVMEDWHSFGQDYDLTLMAWFANFDEHWDEIKDKYGDRFYRMWKYYLLSCAGSFRSRRNQLWQIVYSKHGIMGGYQSIR
ncbi:cyclopropane fatty acyl phospholipid synthase [Patescibacteria group bacterium]